MPKRVSFLCVVLLLASACATDVTGTPEPVSSLLSVRTDKLSYARSEIIVVRTTNPTQATLYDDHCGGETEGFEYLGRWNGSYGSGRACVLERSASDERYPIPPGGVHIDTFFVNSRSYAGTWRVHLLLVDESGQLLPDEQRISNTYHVGP